jgi:hypothetical protein
MDAIANRRRCRFCAGREAVALGNAGSGPIRAGSDLRFA